MSRKFKKSYLNFSRLILKEFMTDKELVGLDKKYNEAKIGRMIKRAKKGMRY